MRTLYLKIYTLLYFLALPGLFIRLLWRARRNPAYRQRWKERLGLSPRSAKPAIWIHAVSVGESIAATPLIKTLQQLYPDYQLVVTTTTPTGSAQIQKTFGNDILHTYMPYDLPFCLKRFLARTQTKLCIIMETEIWPNTLTLCKKHDIPVLFANARLSERSLKRYLHFHSVMKNLLAQVTWVMAQSQEDADRFVTLGIARDRVAVSGNIKFDLEIDATLTQSGQALRQQWQSQARPTFIAGSSHEGEESILLEAFQIIKHTFPNALLIIVPRHPERFDRVFQLCQKTNFSVGKRSTQASAQACDIYLGDTMGELRLLYAASDIAFVGGTLVPVGGHNLIEPAALGLPILSGPHLENCEEIGRLLRKANALAHVEDASMIAAQVCKILSTAGLRDTIRQNGQSVVLQNQGALHKHVKLIARYLPVKN